MGLIKVTIYYTDKKTSGIHTYRSKRTEHYECVTRELDYAIIKTQTDYNYDLAKNCDRQMPQFPYTSKFIENTEKQKYVAIMETLDEFIPPCIFISYVEREGCPWVGPITSDGYIPVELSLVCPTKSVIFQEHTFIEIYTSKKRQNYVDTPYEYRYTIK